MNGNKTSVAYNIDAFLTDDTQKWAPLVSSVTREMMGPAWIPVVLSIIDNESNGHAGIPAHRETRHAVTFPKRTGEKITVKRAYGLMQVIPVNIASWAKAQGRTVFFEDFSGIDMDSARIQIQQGVFVLKQVVKLLAPYLPDLKMTAPSIPKNSLAFVLMAYAIGHVPVIKLLQKMQMERREQTLVEAETSDPNLGKPANRPFFYAKKILKKVAGVSSNLVQAVSQSDLSLVIAAIACVWILSR